MRLHRLEIGAFGPFSGTEVIDFDALSEAGLFLIQGRTGAGKTSVLDAVCFALYGQVPGARGAVKGLRSDHAPPDGEPRAMLEVTIRGRRFRIARSPAWERPKRRGSGTTPENAHVLLEELGPDGWFGLTNRLDEAGDLIGQLLGMTAAQFCQVALLPQGEFAAFLRAGAEERRRVLERLFATEVFTQVEKWLAERRAATRREADELRAAAESTADRIAEAAGVERPAADEPGTLPAWAAELAGQLAAVRDETAAILAAATSELAAARSAAERGRTIAERRRRHEQALRRRDALAAQAAERAALAGRLAAAERAGRVLPLVRAATERARGAELARTHAAEARAAIGELVPADSPEDVLVKTERSRRDEIAGLDGLRAEAVRLREVDLAIAAAGRGLAALDAREAELAAAVAELPDRVAELRAGVQEARVCAARRPGAEAAVRDADRRLAAAGRRDAVVRLLAEAEAAHREAVDAAQAARDRLLDLRQARLDGMAAVLAGELRAGEPCRVCGATEHPAPTESLGVVPTEQDEDRAEASYDAAQARREETGGRIEGLRAELDGVLDVAGEDRVDALGAALAAAREDLTAVDAAEIAAADHEEALQRAEAELTGARDRREEVAQEIAGLCTRRAELAAEADRLRERLDEARGDDPSLQARADRLGHEADALAAAAELLRRADHAETELRTARTAALDAAETEGCTPTQGHPAAEGLAAAGGSAGRDDGRHDRTAAGADEAGGAGSYESGPAAPHGSDEARYAAVAQEVSAAALDDEERGRLVERVRELDDEEAAVREVLGDAELAAAAREPEPDLESLEGALREAGEMAGAAASAADRAELRRARLGELRGALARRVAAWRPAAERHAVAHRLAGLASGQSTCNRLNMRLSAYVLAARLEQVVAAANERLARMSAGRYALEHTVDKAAGDRRGGSGGLGLRVADAWTGQRRDPVTLSGGESFVTALALALGLADVVTAEAGGAEINTLFVDEGFGMLDDDTLDEVMDVLDGLRDGGRAVGIVSHVAELHARIPAQLRVSKRPHGSTVAVHV